MKNLGDYRHPAYVSSLWLYKHVLDPREDILCLWCLLKEDRSLENRYPKIFAFIYSCKNWLMHFKASSACMWRRYSVVVSMEYFMFYFSLRLTTYYEPLITGKGPANSSSFPLLLDRGGNALKNLVILHLLPRKCKGRDQLTSFLIRYSYSCSLAHWHDDKWVKIHKYFRKLGPRCWNNFPFLEWMQKGIKDITEMVVRIEWIHSWCQKYVYEGAQPRGQLFKIFQCAN